jgi:ABC-type uncharacterized transport system substrate-binding protein
MKSIHALQERPNFGWMLAALAATIHGDKIIINLKTAKALGLTMPSQLLELADRLVE